jgi:hypothetical protein
MSQALEDQIGWLGRLLAERSLPPADAAIAAGARASLEFLLKHEDGFRSYHAEVKAAKQSPMVKDVMREFPDAEIVGVRKTG